MMNIYIKKFNVAYMIYGKISVNQNYFYKAYARYRTRVNLNI